MENAEKIKQKLKLAHPGNVRLLDTFCRERFLYRLFLSRYKTKFILKGGSFIYALERDLSRPTKDIDLLGKGISNDPEQLKAIFEEICEIQCAEDGIVFKSVSAETIIKEGQYSGVRLKVKAFLGEKTELNCSIDVGFGDTVINPQELTYPTLLEELDAPLLDAYSVESVIAEKFQAMVDLAESNGRLKDFYDVHRFISQNQYEQEILEEAVLATLHQRETPSALNHPIFEEDFYKDAIRCELWKNFLGKNKLGFFDFKEVLPSIQKLKPIYQTYCESKN